MQRTPLRGAADLGRSAARFGLIDRSHPRKQTARVIVVSFSGALDQTGTLNVGDYHLVAADKEKKFGTRDDKPMPLVSAAYDLAGHTVTLTPRGTVPNQTLQLSITGSSLLDASAQRIDGNRDGQPGGSLAATFGNAGIHLSSVPLPGLQHSISANALDALLVTGRLHARRGARYGRR
jgi:hypothetical protein